MSDTVLFYFKGNIDSWVSAYEANVMLHTICGIRNFFSDEIDFQQLKENIVNNKQSADNEKKAEYGDFQTNLNLANQITGRLKSNGVTPQIIIEPTCGKGHFIIAVLNTFDNINTIFGIEIQKEYVWQAKLNILEFFLNNPDKQKSEIEIFQANAFTFDYNSIKETIGEKKLLIIGNPPWVTNSALSVLKSSNLPQKSNFKQLKGIDALTGKSNFDIGEFITTELLKNFSLYNGYMAFLVKNSVIKNIVYDLPKTKLPISNLKKQNIDSKKEFGVSVDASLFFCQLNKETTFSCQESDFYTSEIKKDFGWLNNKFMSDLFCSNNDIDGISPFEWRQGIKHDCSKVMELVADEDQFYNKLGEKFRLEDDLVFPLLKSSDLKDKVATFSRKKIIVTQKFVGQNTSYIQRYPQTFEYLNNHIEYFQLRKSSIYKGKCEFSIFGIGDYSFKPYKVAISGLYKTFHFCLVTPQDKKPVMLDDTCYFIGFDTKEHAEYVWNLLNSSIVADFLKSISFSDSKRMITKDVLMRIDLQQVAILKDGNSEMLDDIIKKQNRQLQLF